MKCFILQYVSVINFQNLYCNYNIWNPQIQAFQGEIFLGHKLKEIQSLLFSCVRQHPTLSTSQNHKKPPLTLCNPSQQALISACMQMPSARDTYQSQIIFPLKYTEASSCSDHAWNWWFYIYRQVQKTCGC